MSFVRHHDTVNLCVNLQISKTTHNQIELLRRAFEIPMQALVLEAFAAAVQDLFDEKLASIAVLPSTTGPESVEEIEAA